MMTSFVCARLLNTSFLEVSTDDVMVNVTHSQGDGICLNTQINANELQKFVPSYLTAVDKNSSIPTSVSMLGERLDYFLKIYDVYSVGALNIKCQSHGGSFIESQFYLEDLDFCDTNYLTMMSIDGNVLIGRHFLNKFVKDNFNDFLEYVSNEISSTLYNSYQTISDASMNMYSAQMDFSYTRKINKSLTLKIRIQPDDYGDVFNPCEEFSDTQEDAFIYSISHFESMANGNSIPAFANLLIVDENNDEVFSFSSTEYLKKVDDGFKFCDRACFIIEALSEFREQCTAPLVA